MFFERHKRVFRICFLILIPLLLISSVTIDIDNSADHTLDLSPYGIATCYNDGYNITPPDENYGNWKYESVGYDPQIYFFLESKCFNKITVRFAEGVKVNYVQLYYTHEREPNINEKNSLMGSFQKDGRTVNFYLPTENYELIRLDVEGTFAFEEINFINYKRENGLNVLPFVLLLLVLGASIALEGKILLYRSVYAVIKREVLKYREVNSIKTAVWLAMRWLAIISTSVFVLTLFVFTLGIIYSYGSIIAVFWLGVIAAVFDVAYLVLYGGKKNAAALFLVLSLIFGAVLSYTLPLSTYNSWDEDVHYRNSVLLKNMLFLNRYSDADTKQIDRDYAEQDMFIKDLDGKIDEMILDDRTNYWADRGFVNVYSFMTYLPNAVMMTLADLIGMNYFVEVILIKIVNMALYAFIVYFGIRRIRTGTMLVSAIALIPTCVFMASSFSYDHWVVAFVIYAMCYFISEMQATDKLFTRSDGIKMFGAMVIGCSIKAIYFVLMLPMLFMSKEKFENKKQLKIYRWACVLVMLLILILFILPFFVDMNSYSDDRGGSDVDAIGQVKFILGNPLKYAEILIKYIGEYVTFDNFRENIASYCLIGNAKDFFGLFTIIIILACTFLDKSDDIYKNCVKVKVSGLFGCVGSIILIITALYVSYTPVGLNTVNGVQCRYMFPILFTFLYSIGIPLKKNVLDNRVGKGIVYSLLAFNLFASFYSVYITRILGLMQM